MIAVATTAQEASYALGVGQMSGIVDTDRTADISGARSGLRNTYMYISFDISIYIYTYISYYIALYCSVFYYVVYRYFWLQAGDDDGRFLKP